MLGYPISVFIRRHVLVCAQLQDVRAFCVAPRQRDDFVRAEGLCEEDPEMAQTADANYTNALARSAAEALQRRVERNAAAQHWRCLGRGHG